MISRSYRRFLAAGLISASLLVAAGCGDDGDDAGSSDSAALTAEEFRTQADAICKEAEDALDALGEPSSPAELPEFFATATELNSEQLAKLRDLSPPDELQGDFDEALDLLEQQQEVFEDANERIGGGESAMTVIGELDGQVRDISDQADQKAKDLGLTECGDGSSSSDDSGDTSTTSDAADTDPAPAAPAAEVGISVFVADVQSFAQTLTQLGLTMQAAGAGQDELEQRAPLMRTQLDQLDQQIEKMAGYTVDVESLEVKRAAIVEASPDISRLGRELIDAAEDGDGTRAASVAGEMQAALQRLQEAANK